MTQETIGPRSWISSQDERTSYLDALARRSGVSARYLGVRWSHMRIISSEQRQVLNAILQYAKGFNDMRERGVSMAWLGRPGTGKTMLASLLTMHVIRAGHGVLLTDWADVVADLQRAQRFDSDRDVRRVYQDLIYPDLLIIDEIEAEIDAKSRRDMQRIIDKRYKEVKPSVLIGNLSHDEFRDAVGDRVLSRIRQDGGGILTFGWQDMRRANS